MPRSNSTLARQWALLRMIPSRPRRRPTSELHQHLLDLGYEVDIRTVQRDLALLAEQFPLTSEAEGRTLHWHWMPNAARLEIPGMSRSTALVFELARQYLQPLLPTSVSAPLQPYFERAASVLRDSSLADWKERVLHIERGPRLTPPEVDPDVRDAVCQALLSAERFEADYVPRYETTARRYEINPLGLVLREGAMYLVCALREYDNVLQLALHRMHAPALLHRPARTIPGFDLQRYVNEQSAFGYPRSDRPLRLRALFDEGAAVHLGERQLSTDQSLAKTPDGRYRLTATVPDTAELRWWLLGFGDGVEVVGPKALRREFGEIVRNMASMYR